MYIRATMCVIAAVTAVISSAATAQLAGSKQSAASSVGNGGQRQTRTNAADEGIEPMERIDNRIPNRVQNRLRNRIDRFYDPTANATAPFTVASDVARGKRSRTVGARSQR